MDSMKMSWKKLLYLTFEPFAIRETTDRKWKTNVTKMISVGNRQKVDLSKGSIIFFFPQNDKFRGKKETIIPTWRIECPSLKRYIRVTCRIRKKRVSRGQRKVLKFWRISSVEKHSLWESFQKSSGANWPFAPNAQLQVEDHLFSSLVYRRDKYPTRNDETSLQIIHTEAKICQIIISA